MVFSTHNSLFNHTFYKSEYMKTGSKNASEKHFPNPFQQTVYYKLMVAVTPISTFTFLGKVLTATVALAG